MCWMGGVNILWYNILTPHPLTFSLKIDKPETVVLLSLEGKIVITNHG